MEIWGNVTIKQCANLTALKDEDNDPGQSQIMERSHEELTFDKTTLTENRLESLFTP